MTGEHRPTTSRITDALLPTDTPAAETTTRLRPITPTTPPPTRPDPSATRPTPPPAPPAPAAPAPSVPAAPVPPGSTTVPSTPPRPAATPPVPAVPKGAPARPAATASGATAVPPRSATAQNRPTGGPLRTAAEPAGRPDAGGRPEAAPARPAAGPPNAVARTEAAPARPTGGPARPAAAAAGRAAMPARPSAVPAGPAPAPAGRPAVPARPAPVPVSSQPPHLSPYGHSSGPGALPPEAPVEVTTRLRPVRERRTGRTVAVAVCAVLGFGLIGGALAGVWLAAAEPGKPAEPVGYAEAKELWHNAPVDTLFPRTLAGPGAGPGGADRTWTRIVVAPDAACTPAVLAKGLLATVQPLDCARVLRATYTDATASSVITVGLVFTQADAATQRSLGQGLTTRLGADVPPALAGPGTVAERFGAPQRAAWWLNAPADLPVVVTAVSGFADGRTVDGGPVPADRAMAANRTDATAQSGLGHEAKGITERLVRLLRTAATTAAKENAR
ncbi:hypothetical protein [Streptomyces vietnamensis]|uniref:hypothetical protein n=1 Tax=Streptomyces vietnamensis TaxID=362257 RepID=UPI00342010CC